MVMPGVTIRKASEKRASWGLASLFRVCQAMSIAMTTVLPAASRHLEGHAGEQRIGVTVASRNLFSIHASPYFEATSVM